MRIGVLALVCCLSTPVFADDASVVFGRVRDSIVTVIALDEEGQRLAEGSGVAIGGGRIVTNCHVVSEAASVQVKHNTRTASAKPLEADIERDLCIFSVDGLNAPAVKMRPHLDLKVGEAVYAVGNPLGFELSVSAGLISHLTSEPPRVITTAVLSPGSSGGGLFDATGRLVGITTAIWRFGQNVNLALSADWIAEIPKRSKPASVPKTVRAPDAEGVGPDPDYLEQVESLRVAMRWDDLLIKTQEWRRVFPTSAEAAAYAGLALLNLNKPNEARDLLVKAARTHPRHANLRAFLGLARGKLGDAKGARDDILAAIALRPADAYFQSLLAEMDVTAGNLDAALAAVKQANRLAPGEAHFWQLLGDISWRQKRMEAAAQAFQTALRLKPNDAGARANLASVQAYLGRSGEAKQTLGAASKHEGDGGTWLNIGIAEEKKGRYAEAEKAYRKALEGAPKSSETWLRLGLAMVRTNRDADAEQAFRSAIKHDPNAPHPLLALGELLDRRGDVLAALAVYEKAAKVAPGLASVWRAIAYVHLRQRKVQSAIEPLQELVKLEPNAGEDWAYLGDALLKQKRVDEAALALQQAERTAPEHHTTLLALGALHGSRGEYTKALTYTERVLARDSADAAAWSNKGYSLLKLRRYDEAIQALNTAVRLEPDFANPWINLGEANLQVGQLGRAISALEKACALAPGAGDARVYIAQAYLRSGQAGKAKQHIDVLLKIQPLFPTAWYLLAMVHLAQGESKDVLRDYEKLKELHPALAREFRDKVRANPKYRAIALSE